MFNHGINKDEYLRRKRLAEPERPARQVREFPPMVIGSVEGGPVTYTTQSVNQRRVAVDDAIMNDMLDRTVTDIDEDVNVVL